MGLFGNSKRKYEEWTVCALVCTVDKTIKYIGFSKDPEKRYKNHLRDSESNNKKMEWIINLSLAGSKPEMHSLGTFHSERSAREFEQRLIGVFKAFSDDILNIKHDSFYKTKRII